MILRKFFLFVIITVVSCNRENKATSGCTEEKVLNTAEREWLKVYGKAIYDKKPFIAILKDSIWTVQGTLPDNYDGGVPYAEINYKTCQIIRVSHGK